MNIIVFGATGMVGSGVLKECLEDDRVKSILVIGRTSCKLQHPKLKEIIHADFFDYGNIREDFKKYDACFYCLGVSVAGMTEAKYTQLTHHLTLAAAEFLASQNQNMTFCYLSAAGADSTETSRLMWARVRGKTENDLLKLPFRLTVIFRPGYIHPMKGVRSKTLLYRVSYIVLGPFYPIFRRLIPDYLTTTEKIGLAMIHIAQNGYPKTVLSIPDINWAAERH